MVAPLWRTLGTARTTGPGKPLTRLGVQGEPPPWRVGLWLDQTGPGGGCHRTPRPPHGARARQGRAGQRSRPRLHTGAEPAHDPLEPPPNAAQAPQGAPLPPQALHQCTWCGTAPGGRRALDQRTATGVAVRRWLAVVPLPMLLLRGGLASRTHVSEGFCRKVRFLGQNPKIEYREFNDLQTAKLSKKQLCDRTNEAAIKSYNAEHGTAIAIRNIKYLNDIVAQDYRSVQRVTRPMLGLKSFEAAHDTLVGIKLMPRS